MSRWLWVSLAVLGSVVSLAIGFYWGNSFDRGVDPDWQAISAIFTALAVGVALAPIWIDHVRRIRQAHNLRFRVWHKLKEIKPTIYTWAVLRSMRHRAYLEPDLFKQAVSEMGALNGMAGILSPEEHDHLGQLNMHLSMLSKERVPPDQERAKVVLFLIDATLGVIERVGSRRFKVARPPNNLDDYEPDDDYQEGESGR